jgi:spore coat protein A
MPSPGLTKYLDPLPIPPVLQSSGIVNGLPRYNINMSEFQQRLHSQLPPTTLWGYNGLYPGPTFEMRSGMPVTVKFVNYLPTTHLLQDAIDPTLHGTEPPAPYVRNVVHLHGARILPESDGYPEAWFTPGFTQTGPFFTTDVYTYPNDQPATTLWYHDHALGSTRLNVVAGLEGYYLIRDGVEDGLNLPRGPYEIPLMIQDRSFNGDGSLSYPTQGVTAVHPVWSPEYFGDMALVNGKIWPFLEVEQRRYRFRILNGSNARFYNLFLDSGQPFFQIGTDGGFLPAAVPVGKLLLAPAERADVIVDFSALPVGTLVQLMNNAKAPYPSGTGLGLPQIMQFRVVRRKGTDTSTPPASLKLPPVPLLVPASAVKTRDVVLTETADPVTGNPLIGQLDNAMWSDPVIEDPKVGTTEIWRIINTTGDAHPIHVHLVQFQVLDQQPFDVAQYQATNQLVFTRAASAPAANERPAWKDTVKSLPGQVTRIIAKFDLPTGTSVTPGQKFRYVWHCHILEHEDNEMMRPFDVIA